MKTLAEFTKTTLIGGVLVILPIYITVLLLAKTVKGLLALLAPVSAQIPAGVEFRQIVAFLLLVAVCFVVGLIVRTGPCAPRMPSSGLSWMGFLATPFFEGSPSG